MPGLPKWRAAPDALVRTFATIVPEAPGVEPGKTSRSPCQKSIRIVRALRKSAMGTNRETINATVPEPPGSGSSALKVMR